jgi:hypothetical protein
MTQDSPNSSHADEDAAMPRGRRSRSRPLVLGMLFGLLVVAAAVGGYLFATRPHNRRLTEADYEAAVARWDRYGPKDYELDIELTGNRPGLIHVEVRDGEVVRMTRDGVEPKQKRTWFYWSVPGQFDTISQELEMSRDPAAAFRNPAITQMVMWAEFDPKLGYPLKYDRVVLGADYEVHWRVTRFRALEP